MLPLPSMAKVESSLVVVATLPLMMKLSRRRGEADIGARSAGEKFSACSSYRLTAPLVKAIVADSSVPDSFSRTESLPGSASASTLS